MTAMSRFLPAARGPKGSKPPKLRPVGAMARPMLRQPAVAVPLAIAAALATGSGCLLPPDLEPSDPDAGLSSPPVILSASPPEFAFPGPMILDRQDERTMSLTVQDNDVEDVVYVRLYVDYDEAPGPAYAECQAASTGERTRVVACPLNSICTPLAATDTDDHQLEAMVADREFIANSDPAAEGQPLFRALRQSEQAAYSFRSWLFRCNAPEEP